MSDLDQNRVERWLDDHPDFRLDYFLRKADVHTVNAWLVTHGYSSVTRFSPPEFDDDGPFAVSFRKALANYLDGEPEMPDTAKLTTYRFVPENIHYKPDSEDNKQEFGKSKSLFQPDEPSTSEPSTSRRESLKEMRKAKTLPPTTASMLSLLTESKVKLPQGFPFYGRGVKNNLRKKKGENALFLQLIRDIAAEMDMTSLNVKVAENLAILLNGEGASLFVIETRRGRPTLVSRHYHIRQPSDSRDRREGEDASVVKEPREIHVPRGVGILGCVAETGETVIAQVAEKDPRFDGQVDRVPGHKTESLLCMPVKNPRNEIIGVVQIVNKKKNVNGGSFTDNDASRLRTYLQFIGIAITNAQLLDFSRREYEKNRSLLGVVHDLFDRQTSVDKVVVRIMQRSLNFIKCGKTAVLLLEDTIENSSYARLFELSADFTYHEPTAKRKERSKAVTTYLVGAAENVLRSEQPLNISEIMDEEHVQDRIIQNLLAVPIRNSRSELIGVATIVDKANEVAFDGNDEELYSVFTILCGLGIHGTHMFNELEKAMARQKVALEVLSYHASATTKEVQAVMKQSVPNADDFNLYSLSFDDFSLDADEMVGATVAMFLHLDVIQRFNIEKETLYRFLVSVRKNYRDVPYHNWRHAFNVAQFMFAIFMGCDMKDTFSELEVLGMFVGCLCHDLDHRGTNNAYQQKSGSPLVLLYGTTNTMEHHHFNHAVMILSSEKNNILSGLSPEEYLEVIEILRHSIIATDLSVYFQNRTKFFELVKTRGYSWEIDNHRELLRAMLMTASDLAASCKPWQVEKRVAQLVTSEFFEQGDKERDELKLTPQPLMDRERRHELPQLQVGWMTDVCIPLYESLTEMNPKFSPMLDGAIENKNQWQKIVDENKTLNWDLDEENL